MTKKTKGLISIPLTLAISVGMVVIGGITVFWKTAGSTDGKINEVKTEVLADISEDRQRISTLEEAVKTIKEDTSEIKDNLLILIQRK